MGFCLLMDLGYTLPPFFLGVFIVAESLLFDIQSMLVCTIHESMSILNPIILPFVFSIFISFHVPLFLFAALLLWLVAYWFCCYPLSIHSYCSSVHSKGSRPALTILHDFFPQSSIHLSCCLVIAAFVFFDILSITLSLSVHFVSCRPAV